MREFKKNLTRLKTLITTKFPDDGDILGYAGVTRKALLDAITVAYNLSNEIKESEESRFEVVSLKRSGSELYVKLKAFLDSTEGEEKRKKGFNDFLKSYAELIEKTKITYFIVAQNGIHSDEELTGLRTRIERLSEFCDQFAVKNEKLAETHESILSKTEEITTNHENSSKCAEDMEKWCIDASSKYDNVKEIHDAIAGWDEDILKYQQQFKELSAKIKELNEESIKSQEQLSKFEEIDSVSSAHIKETSSQHDKLIDEIRHTLAGANRAGMAASFNKRKDELKWSQRFWPAVFIGAIGAIVFVVWKFILPTISAQTPEWTKLAVELGMISPLVWLGWFAVKQYGYISRIREDYAFKAASAMAYEGHKKAAREINKELEESLLSISLLNMSQNPIRLYKGEVDGTPLQEIFGKLMDKVPSIKKVTASAPTQGKVAVSAKSNDDTGV